MTHQNRHEPDDPVIRKCVLCSRHSTLTKVLNKKTTCQECAAKFDTLWEMWVDTDFSRESEHDLYPEAVRLWGVRSQAGQLMEECAELITETHKHFFRGMLASTEDVALEIADVEIMLAQIKLGIPDTILTTAKNFKLDRLRKLIHEAKEKE